MGALVWGPLGQGLLTGRVRKNQHNDLRRAGLVRHLSDERRLDVVEKLIPLAAEAGLPMTHLAMAFTIAHPGVTSALLGARTMDHLDDLLAGLDVTLTDDILDRIDEIVPPGTDVGTLDQAYQPPALQTRACAAAPRPNAPQPDHSSPPRRTGEVVTPGLNWAERFEDAFSGNAAPSEPERCARHSCGPGRDRPVHPRCRGMPRGPTTGNAMCPRTN